MLVVNLGVGKVKGNFQQANLTMQMGYSLMLISWGYKISLKVISKKFDKTSYFTCFGVLQRKLNYHLS